MAKLSQDRKSGNRHPRENILSSGNLAAANAELIIDCDGSSTIALDVRGTFVGTLEVSGTTDGTNYQLLPVRQLNAASVGYVASFTNTAAPGTFVAPNTGFDRVRVRMTAYTSGSATVVLCASNQQLDPSMLAGITTSAGTATAAAGTAVTLTLAAPGAGLRHYITSLSVVRFATAALTAAATPVVVTTTNLPGSLAFSFPADAALQGTVYREELNLSSGALASSAQNTATTIVCPTTTNVIWRVNATFYAAP